jgi:hypothetical protein
VPLVLVGYHTTFAFLAGLLGAVRVTSNWRDPKRIFHCAMEAARDNWVETTWLACGHVASLPVPSIRGATQEQTGSEEEKIKGVANATEQELAGMSLRDEEKQVLDSVALNGAPHLEVRTRTHDTPTPISLRCLQCAVTIPLGYLSIVTLLLCKRRASINANAIVDNILWHLALTGLSTCAQAIIILCTGATAPFRQSTEEQPAMPTHSTPLVDESFSQAKDSTASPKPRISLIPFIRFGGLIHGVDMNTNDKDEDSLKAFGRLGPLDKLASLLIFNKLIYLPAGNRDYAYLATLDKIASNTIFLSVLPNLLLILFALVGLTLTASHKWLSRIFADCRAVKVLESLLSKNRDLVDWVRAQYARVPETLRLLLERGYLPLWVLCVYSALYLIVIQEIMRFGAREHLRAYSLRCLRLWHDPLAEKLLWPIFVDVENLFNHTLL